jgi:hypothetical protein
MRSRFLARLDDELANANDRFSRRCLLAERSAYQARLGALDLARIDLDSVQAENGIEPHVRVSILINIAAGLCYYYEDMSPAAKDRYQRARALALASQQADLQARVDSYIALLEYGSHSFEQMFKHLDDAAESVSKADSETLCRICMIVGQTLHLANRFDLSAEWYRSAKKFANEASDDASMSAILYNMASIWSVNIRNYKLGGIKTRDESDVAWIAANSTWNFDKIIGSSGLAVLTPLMKAQMQSLDCKYEEALATYKSTLPSLTIRSIGGWQSWLLADMAWCSLQLGFSEQARTGFARAVEGLKNNHHHDDRAATLTRLAEGMTIIGEIELADSYRAAADQAWASFAALQFDMHALALHFLERRGSLTSTDRVQSNG